MMLLLDDVIWGVNVFVECEYIKENGTEILEIIDAFFSDPKEENSPMKIPSWMRTEQFCNIVLCAARHAFEKLHQPILAHL